jgi:hypothetical protein
VAQGFADKQVAGHTAHGSEHQRIGYHACLDLPFNHLLAATVVCVPRICHELVFNSRPRFRQESRLGNSHRKRLGLEKKIAFWPIAILFMHQPFHLTQPG